MENGEKKKKGIRLVSRKSTKKMLGRWKRLENTEKAEIESEKKPVRMIMGKTLSEVIEIDPSLDGIPLPAFFRYSLDYVEENGLYLEGIYRISSPKSRLDELESNVNEGKELVFRDAHEAAGLIKRFLRQLPEQLVPGQIEKAADTCTCDWKTKCSCGATKAIKHLLNQLDKSQYYLLTYIFLHAQNVVKHECENKMGIPALGLLLQTVLEMSRKLICIFIQNASSLSNEKHDKTLYLFPDVHILTYVPPKSCREVEEWQCEDKPLIEDELNKQNNLLNYLHNQFSAMSNNSNEETSSWQATLWDVQTAITALKRRLKSVAEPIPSSQSCPLENKPFLEMYEEKQLVAVQSMLRKDIVEERKLVAIMLWNLQNSTEHESTEFEAGKLNEDDPTKSEGDMEEECLKEESIRLSLVEDICKLKMECALLRAKNEMLSHGHTVSTRF